MNSDEFERRTHPMEYSGIVEQFAGEHGLDKFLIYAVIKTESDFRADAESNLGARGLMQIMPDTFDWIKWRWYGDSEWTFDDMYDPEVNIRFGARLISYHMNYYRNVDNTLAAYHAGDGAVDGWLKNPDYSSDGETLDVIPFPDTWHYVEKVNKAYEIYIKLYGGQ